jgi:hypothetical protein
MVKQGSAGWHGVSAHQTHMRTCDLELPRGHATVKCGVYGVPVTGLQLITEQANILKCGIF